MITPDLTNDYNFEELPVNKRGWVHRIPNEWDEKDVINYIKDTLKKHNKEPNE